MPRATPELCPDWFWAHYPKQDDADRGWHVANHRGWFTNYTPLSEGQVYAHPRNDPAIRLPVMGVGKVKLTVRVFDTPSATREVILRDVLHIPDMQYGIICQKRLALRENETYKTTLDNPAYSDGVVFDKNGKEVVMFNHIRQLPSQLVPTPPGSVITLYDVPRNCRRGPSRFQTIIDNGVEQPWAAWVTVKEDFWPVITEAYELSRNSAA